MRARVHACMHMCMCAYVCVYPTAQGPAFTKAKHKDKAAVVQGGKVDIDGVARAVKWIGAFTDGPKQITNVQDKVGGRVSLSDSSTFENPSRPDTSKGAGIQRLVGRQHKKNAARKPSSLEHLRCADLAHQVKAAHVYRFAFGIPNPTSMHISEDMCTEGCTANKRSRPSQSASFYWWPTGSNTCPKFWSWCHTASPPVSLVCLGKSATQGMCSHNCNTQGTLLKKDMACPPGEQLVKDSAKKARNGDIDSPAAIAACCTVVV